MIDANRAADLLIAARKGDRIAELPAALSPQSVAEAYALQDAMIARLGPVGGWKIAAGSGPEPLCSPLPGRVFHVSPARLDGAAAQVMIAEVEVAVLIGHDLPPRDRAYGNDDALAAIASLHPAIELIGSCFIDRSQVDKLTLLGDLQSNAAVITGAAPSEWQSIDLARLPLSLSYDGVVAGTADSGPSFDEVVSAIAWLANHSAARNGGLKADQIVITGSRVNKPFSGSGVLVAADIAGLGQASVTL